MKQIILKITHGVLGVFILIVCMNAWLSTLHKGNQRLVGADVVSVYTPQGHHADQLLVPIQDHDFADTGSKVAVYLHNSYQPESHLKNMIRNITVLFIAYLFLGKVRTKEKGSEKGKKKGSADDPSR